MYMRTNGIYPPFLQVVKVWDIESGQFVFEFSVQSGISAMDIDSCGRR